MGNALFGEETFKLLLDAAPDAVVLFALGRCDG